MQFNDFILRFVFPANRKPLESECMKTLLGKVYDLTGFIVY
jgi:hypothetical protein